MFKQAGGAFRPDLDLYSSSILYSHWKMAFDHRIRYLALSTDLFQSLRRSGCATIPGLEIVFVVLELEDKVIFWKGAFQTNLFEVAWKHRKAYLSNMYTKNPFRLGEATRNNLDIKFVDGVEGVLEEIESRNKSKGR